jgi:serine/threonine protein kinase
MALNPGSRIGPYEILSTLGAGGMGQVYRAKDTRLGRIVAVKAMHESFAQDPERVARFQREAQLLASLNHPNIAAIHGVEELQGARFLVLEFVDGRPLSDILQGGAPPFADAMAIAKQIAGALATAHERGIIHRDLKPGNVMVTPDGQVKVLDFGLGKAIEGESSHVASPAGHRQFADDDDGGDAGGDHSGYGRVHESGASEGPDCGQAQRRVGVWLRAVRVAHRQARV